MMLLSVYLSLQYFSPHESVIRPPVPAPGIVGGLCKRLRCYSDCDILTLCGSASFVSFSMQGWT